MKLALWCLGIWLSIGAGVTIRWWEPEMGGWFWCVLLWPAVLGAKLAGWR